MENGKKDFTLCNVKLSKNGGLDAKYEIVESLDGADYVKCYKASNSLEAHNDLKNLFTELRPIVARVFLRDVPSQSIIDCIEVCGVSFSGQGENGGVVIRSTYTAENGLSATVCTPRLKLNSNIFGFEGELQRALSLIEKEVYAYLFENKHGEMSIFGE